MDDEAYLLQFQSTLPAGEATSRLHALAVYIHHFNPRFPRGERHCFSHHHTTFFNFNPRFPRGKRPRIPTTGLLNPDISIHASRGGSDGKRSPEGLCGSHFNPRFPRGKRLSDAAFCGRYTWISIHASRGGSDKTEPILISFSGLFQSTLPAGEATSG